MKKRRYLIATLSLLLIMVFTLSACGGEQKETLTLYTWAEMFPDEVLTNFKEETGINVNYVNFDTDETMLQKLQSTNGGDYDLVIADDYIIETVIKENLAQKLDKSKISTLNNIDPRFQGAFYDKTDEYTVPYGAGVPLILYDPAVTGFELTSYEDLWDSRLEDNLALIGNYRVINGITLNTLNESMNTENLDKIREAGKKMQQLSKNVRVISDTNTQDYLLSGEVSAAFLYTSQVNAVLSQTDAFKVCYPSEGSGFGLMAGFVPSNAPNSEAAHKFLEYINKPEVAAKCFEFMGYYTTNKASEAFISDEMKPLLVLPEDVRLGEMIQSISVDADDVQKENFNNFKIG